MASFEYRALKADGTETSGNITAVSYDDALDQLENSGLIPLRLRSSVRENDAVGTRVKISLAPRRGLSSSELVSFTTQLGTLVGAELPLAEALRVIHDQAESRALSDVSAELLDYVNAGEALSSAMMKGNGSFGAAYIATVSVGEKGGDLAGVLNRLADHARDQAETRSRVKLAMIYPSIIVLVSVVVIGLLIGYVVPQIAAVIEDANGQLPGVTLFFIGLSRVVSQWHLWVPLLTSMIVTSYFCLKVRLIRGAVDRLALRLPSIGKIVRIYHCSLFCKTLSMLYESGSPLAESIEIAGRTVRNTYLGEQIALANREIYEGMSFLGAFGRRDILPAISLHLIASGQSNGRLGSMLDRAADDLAQELRNRLSTTVAMLEPLLMLTMGGIVLAIVMAVMLPILDMNQLMM